MGLSTAIIAAVLLAILNNVTAYQFGLCPKTCVCKAYTLECGDISSVYTWLEFLKVVPHETTSLKVTGSTFASLNLPNEFCSSKFPHVVNIKMENCNISVIGTNAFRLFPHLNELYLDSDDIQEIEETAFNSLTILKLLSLRGNIIKRINEKTFYGLDSLDVLDLAYNKVDILYPKVFDRAAHLRTLNLSNNEIHYVSPVAFHNLSNLHIIDLSENKLRSIHPDTFMNLDALTQVLIENNPWSCDCGMNWLRSNATEPVLLHLKQKLHCHSPTDYNEVSLASIAPSKLACTNPRITTKLTDVELLRLGSKVLRCNVTGTPRPSVYWITPRGVIAVHQNRMWISPQIVRFKDIREGFKFSPYPKSKLVAQPDGSLVIHHIRPYFAGEYTCIAENPGGQSSISFNITLKTTFKKNFQASMAVGGMTAVCFFIISAIYASIRAGVRHCLKLDRKESYAIEEEEAASYCSEPSDQSSRFFWLPEYISPYESPMKCTTPNEPEEGEENEQRAHIRETLEDVRTLLRDGVERSVTKIRSGAHHVTESSRQYIHSMRESSNSYMQNIRESGTHTIHNLRSTSSNAANKVRAGVVMSVEQVKCHVQSMKELCHTGNIGQTISTISVTTDVDTQRSMDVVKKITYV